MSAADGVARVALALQAVARSETPGVEVTSPLQDVLGALEHTLHWLLDLPTQASEAARQLDNLQYLEFTLFFALGTATTLLAAWFVFRYRRRGPIEFPPTPQVRSPAWLELGAGFGILAMFVFFWVVGFRQYVGIEVPPAGSMDVYVTARQWVWKFAYADGPATAGVLYLPRGRPVRLLLTSRDVIHSFFVPAFRMKQDAVPGRYTTIGLTPTRTGRFQILCAEYCGAGHSRMWGEVVVLEPDRFEAWLEGQTPADASPDTLTPLTSPGAPGPPGTTMVQRGFTAAAGRGCFRCHSTDGSPNVGPTWQGLYGSRVRLASGDTAIADEAYLTRSMMDPMADIVAGFDPVMPVYQGLLPPGDAAAIIEYIKSIAGPPSSFTGQGSGANPNGPDSTAPGLKMRGHR